MVRRFFDTMRAVANKNALGKKIELSIRASRMGVFFYGRGAPRSAIPAKNFSLSVAAAAAELQFVASCTNNTAKVLLASLSARRRRLLITPAPPEYKCYAVAECYKAIAPLYYKSFTRVRIYFYVYTDIDET